MWEDERNKCGGRWLVNLDKRKRGAELDRFWLETVCATVTAALALCLFYDHARHISWDICFLIPF